MRPTAPRRPTFRRRPLDGFTLIELLVVITIIAILAGMLLGAIIIGRETARKSASRQVVRQVAMAIAQYADTYGEAPPEKAPGNLYSPECLTVFLAGGLLPDESGNAAEEAAIRAKRDFLKRKTTLLTDADKNGYPEIVDAWGMPVLYSRTRFASLFSGDPSPGRFSNDDNATSGGVPQHNPKTYDVFSGNTYGRVILGDPAKIGVSAYDIKALERNTGTSEHAARYPYKYEYVKSPGLTNNRDNAYIGNW